MNRIVVGEIMHESSSFAKFLTEEENFRRTLMWYEKEDVWKLCEIGMKDYLTGIMETGKDRGLEISPCFCAFASPSGVISAACFESLKKHFFDGIDNEKQIDGFCLALHGAGVSECTPDVEGSILEEICGRYGRNIPLVMTLDPHANITRKMTELATVLIPSKLYPHTDTYETGRKAADILHGILEGKVHPTMHVERIEMLIPITKGCTYEEPMKSVIEKCMQAEQIEGVLDCSFAQGFPYSDIEECGAAVVVTTDNKPELARKIAVEIAGYIIERKRDFISDCLTVTEGVDKAEQFLCGKAEMVVMNEVSDNPGAGTPGDGTYLLRELIKRDIGKTCCGAVIDKEAVEQAVASGAGTTVDIRLGGKTDDMHGEPIELKNAYVKSICDGKYNLLSAMTHDQPVKFGTCVRLTVGNVDIVVASNGFRVMDDGLFSLLGINVKEYKIVAVKSAQHFKAYFKNMTKHIITVDSPGISTGRLEELPFRHIPRPIFPIDM